jgi:hypothetical protein
MLLAVVAVLACGMALAQALDVPRNVIAGGGGQSTGGTFVVQGTIGQPQAVPPASGGGFTLQGGFWAPPPAPRPDAVFNNGFEP